MTGTRVRRSAVRDARSSFASPHLLLSVQATCHAEGTDNVRHSSLLVPGSQETTRSRLLVRVMSVRREREIERPATVSHRLTGRRVSQSRFRCDSVTGIVVLPLVSRRSRVKTRLLLPLGSEIALFSLPPSLSTLSSLLLLQRSDDIAA